MFNPNREEDDDTFFDEIMGARMVKRMHWHYS